ncbi:ABC transporter substrate-binding protein [Gammaproteobacteria bacterium 42_54_T18]|nr:ABC transporter substrate-binding protein [Gammaproteobacteria bacterium 42_54_T18]
MKPSSIFSKVLVATILVMLSVMPVVHAKENSRLVLTGSSTVAPLALEMAKRFEKSHPGVRIDVQTGGSSRGVADARAGRADIGMASRSLKQSESDLFSHTIALDGITIILNKNNPIKTLSNVQIRNIYTGKIKNWLSLGGANTPITVVNKAEGRSTLELFLHHLMLKNSDIKASVIIGDNQQGIKTVSGNSGAIGYVSVGAAVYEAEYGTPIKLLPMGGVEANVEEIKRRRFPLSRPLNFITKQEPKGLVEQFILFAQSTVVNDLIEEQFFVSLAKPEK